MFWQSTYRSAFWPTLWFVTLLIAVKGYYLGLPESLSIQIMWGYIRDLSAISYQDALFGLGVGTLYGLLLAVASSRRSLTKSLRVLFPIFYGLSIIYSIANLHIFTYYRTPLTYPLLYLAGNLSNMRSSVMAQLDPQTIALLAGAPAAFGFVLWKVNSHASSHRPNRLWTLTAMLALIAWIGMGVLTYQSKWRTHKDRKIASNAVVVFASSFVHAMTSENAVPLKGDFLPDDLDDFKPIGPSTSSTAGFFSQSEGPVNVILLVMESVPAYWLSIYGSPYNATPNLSAEARHSLIFDNFYCHVGRTSNSLAAILLSTYPAIGWRDITRDYPELPGVPVAHTLHERGYRTAFITSTDLQWVELRDFLGGRGFDQIWDFHDFECTPPFSSWGVEDRCMIDAMLKWIEADSGKPFFLFGWTDQTHHPYEPTPGAPLIDFFQGNLPPDDYDLGRYLNVLHETDRHLGRLFAALRQKGLDRRTVVVLTGDHGQAFGYPHDTYGHSRTLYEEDVRVPLMIWAPGLYQHEERSTTIGSLIDLSPTITDILGISPAAIWQGRSLFAPNRTNRSYFFATGNDYILGVRDGNWKYLFNASLGVAELYDLSRDPTEQRNVAPQYPELCERLRSRLAAWVEANHRQYAGLTVAVR